MTSPENPAKPEIATLTWVPPLITFIGDVADLVKGGGKSGPGDDGDPMSITKGGA